MNIWAWAGIKNLICGYSDIAHSVPCTHTVESTYEGMSSRPAYLASPSGKPIPWVSSLRLLTYSLRIHTAPTDTDLRSQTSSTNTCSQRALPPCLLITWPVSFFNNGGKRLSPSTSKVRVEALPMRTGVEHTSGRICVYMTLQMLCHQVIRFMISSRHPGDSFTGWRLFIGVCLLAFQARCGDGQGASPVLCVFTLIP